MTTTHQVMGLAATVLVIACGNSAAQWSTSLGGPVPARPSIPSFLHPEPPNEVGRATQSRPGNVSANTDTVEGPEKTQKTPPADTDTHRNWGLGVVLLLVAFLFGLAAGQPKKRRYGRRRWIIRR